MYIICVHKFIYAKNTLIHLLGTMPTVSLLCSTSCHCTLQRWSHQLQRPRWGRPRGWLLCSRRSTICIGRCLLRHGEAGLAGGKTTEVNWKETQQRAGNECGGVWTCVCSGCGFLVHIYDILLIYYEMVFYIL